MIHQRHGSRRLIAALGRDESGAIALIASLLATMLLAFLALSVEVGLWYKENRQLQTAADAAAFAGALERARGNTAGYEQVAEDEAVRNGAVAAEVTVNSPPATGTYAANAVEVLINHSAQLLLSSMFLTQAPTIHVRSVAGTVTSGNFCVLALSGTAAGAVTATGNASVDMSGCSIASNSTSASSMLFAGSSDVEALGASAAGSISGEESHLTTTEGIQESQPALPDPYADLEVPAFDPTDCQPQNSFGQHDGPTISPGVYCGGLSFGSQANITLQPGVYIVDGGDFDVNGQATISGDGVTIILTSSSGSDWGEVTINGGADVNLTADDEGDYAGVVMFSDPDSDPISVRFNGGADLAMTGALYFPTGAVTFNGNSSGSSACTQIVGLTVEFSGSSGIGSDCTGVGTQSIGYAKPTLLD
ncbi:MAG: hypothetical protein HQL41_18765 [Alphaproteobacteria bacterium]|nr:hypothetical protein [Alphaproteobacteria bacterium]